MKTRIRFSSIELKHLSISWIAISLAFAIAMTYPAWQNFGNLPMAMLISAFTVGLGFLLHELGHKYLAQKYGCFAEYRSDFRMLVFAVLVSFTGFIFAAPGAVLISGHVTKEQNGRISIAGPLINLLLALLFLLLLLTPLTELASFGFRINAWLALFNMIPLGFFDGKKVLNWSKSWYFSLLMASAVLVFVSFL